MLTIKPATEWKPDTEGAFSLPEAVYRAAPGLNYSILKLIDQSPQHCRQAQLYPEADTPSRRYLRGVHCAVLEPARFNEEHSVGKCPGKVALTELQATRINGIQQAVKRCHELNKIIAYGKTEVSIFAMDPTWNVMTKARIDILAFDIDDTAYEYDLKNCGDARIKEFYWQVKKRNWIEQRAFYRDRLKILGVKQVRSAIVPIEDDAPHGITIYPIDPPDLDKARERYNRWLEIYCQCLKKDEWPGYPEYSRFERPNSGGDY